VIGESTRERRCALVGHPVAHSRSPQIHKLFAAQFGLPLRYDLIDVQAGGFAAAVRGFFRVGGLGLNVTVPHKQAACALAESVSERAEEAGAANTLAMKNGRIVGDNTDGPGLVRDLRNNHCVDLTGARILLIGAGGAARGCLGSLLDAKPSRVCIANRTESRARDLATLFSGRGSVAVRRFSDAHLDAPFDLLIHATSAGLADTTPDLDARCVRPETVCYDMYYAPGATPFLAWSERAGATRRIAGWGMLVEQAAESFRIWHGLRPETGPVIDRLMAGQQAPDSYR
jgi:shikimate dehydrogenase